MRKPLTQFVRVSPAMVVAMLALLVAMSGTAVAARSLITGAQIKNSSITGADIKNRSLTPRDFRGSVRGPRGLQGPAGGPGAKGDKGDKGDKGEAGATNVTVRYIDRNIPTMNSVFDQVASCAAGERAIAGGYHIFNILVSTVHVYADRPIPASQGAAPTGWSASVYNPTAIAGGVFRIYVICASP